MLERPWASESESESDLESQPAPDIAPDPRPVDEIKDVYIADITNIMCYLHEILETINPVVETIENPVAEINENPISETIDISVSKSLIPDPATEIASCLGSSNQEAQKPVHRQSRRNWKRGSNYAIAICRLQSRRARNRQEMFRHACMHACAADVLLFSGLNVLEAIGRPGPYVHGNNADIS